MSPAGRDEKGAAEKGSQLQLQIYANRRPEELDKAILDSLPALAAEDPQLEWRSPLEGDGYAEYWDAGFLAQVGCDDLADELKQFWPAGGPRWDGLAIAHLSSGEDGVLLIEAKSYPQELYGSGTKAGESGSERGLANRDQIAQALRSTQEALGVKDPNPEAWMGLVDEERGSLYQTANRLAQLLWLRELLPEGKRRKACLANVVFVDDPTFKQTSHDDWLEAIPESWRLLGLDGTPRPDCVAHPFLPGLPREELT